MGGKESKLLKKLPHSVNPNNLEFLGSGIQGEVYRINPRLCIKLFKKKKYFFRELNNLQRGRHSPLFPKINEWGNYYIIREYISGISLSSYLEEGHPFTKSTAIKIITIWEGLRELGFTRLDFRIPHIYFLPDGKVKIIDPANLMENDRKYPKQLLAGLKAYGVKQTFLALVEEISPDIYREWLK